MPEKYVTLQKMTQGELPPRPSDREERLFIDSDGKLKSLSGATGEVADVEVAGAPDAPSDGVLRGRKNGAWSQIESDDLPNPLEAVVIPRKGTATEIGAITLAQGEIASTTDTKKLYLGDGVTPGGIPQAISGKTVAYTVPSYIFPATGNPATSIVSFSVESGKSYRLTGQLSISNIGLNPADTSVQFTMPAGYQAIGRMLAALSQDNNFTQAYAGTCSATGGNDFYSPIPNSALTDGYFCILSLDVKFTALSTGSISLKGLLLVDPGADTTDLESGVVYLTELQ